VVGAAGRLAAKIAQRLARPELLLLLLLLPRAVVAVESVRGMTEVSL